MSNPGFIDELTGNPRIMCFRPTYEEFKDFNAYIESIEECGGHNGGVVKIRPPKEWVPRKNGYNFDEIDIRIPVPIKQTVSSDHGYGILCNEEKDSMTLRQFKDLTKENCYKTPRHYDYEDLEKKYWKNISRMTPIYGADIPGSLCDEGLDVWNINRLGSILDSVKTDYGVQLQGVNNSYLDFGMWRSSFAWHTEDMDLYSINYLHVGAPKTWYVVPPKFGRRFEQFANQLFPKEYRNCPAHLRHKTIMISPAILKKNNIPFNKITQEPGEIVITFPFGYYSGFNHGFNVAESTNFATERWIEYGKHASMCRCTDDMVRIDMEAFVKRFQPERYQNWLKHTDYGCHPADYDHHVAPRATTSNDVSGTKTAKSSNKSLDDSIKMKNLSKVQSNPDIHKAMNAKVFLDRIGLDTECIQLMADATQEKEPGEDV